MVAHWRTRSASARTCNEADKPPLLKKSNLRQSLPAAGIIEESESARGERGRVGQGRVGFRVQVCVCWEKAIYATCLFKKMVLITKMLRGSICVRR